MIDAEESWIQKAIDEIAYDGMELYNRKEVIIYNTIAIIIWSIVKQFI